MLTERYMLPRRSAKLCRFGGVAVVVGGAVVLVMAAVFLTTVAAPSMLPSITNTVGRSLLPWLTHSQFVAIGQEAR